MLGLGETLARRRGLLRAMKSLRGLEDYYRRIVFSVADQTTPRDNRVQENCRHDRVLALLRPYCPALLPEGRAAGRSKADC